MSMEQVIRDVNASMPERKLVQIIERTNLSADMKALLADIAHVTVEVGATAMAIGRKIVQFVLDLAKAFPTVTLGIIAAAVVSSFVSGIPLFGALFVKFLGPMLTLLGLSAAALHDLLSDELQGRIDALVSSFGSLVGN